MQISPDMQEHFKFLLLDKFSLMAFSAAVDTLRQANRKVGREPYTWCDLKSDRLELAPPGIAPRIAHWWNLYSDPYVGQGGAFGGARLHNPLGEPR